MADYGTDSGLEAYAEARGVTLVGDTTILRHAGTLFIDSVYAGRFVGQKATWTQLEQWPRINAYWPDGTPVSGTPDQIAMATYEAVTSGVTSASMTVTPGKIKRRSRVEGAIDVSYAVNENDSYSAMIIGQIPINLTIEGYLAGLVSSLTPTPGILVV